MTHDEIVALILRTTREHTVGYFPNSPDGTFQTAQCRCGWNSFFNIEEENPHDVHLTEKVVAALVNAGVLLVEPSK